MRTTDHAAEGQHHDRINNMETILEKHVAECGMLRTHLETQMREFRLDIRGIRNLIIATGGIVIGGSGTLIMFLLDKVWK